MTSVERNADGAIVHGHCEPGFERVRAALAEILASGSEVGAALAVYVGKHAVVDLWGGHTDAARTRPWDRDTIVNLYSIGKAVTAVCALRLVVSLRTCREPIVLPSRAARRQERRTFRPWFCSSPAISMRAFEFLLGRLGGSNPQEFRAA